MITSPKYEEAVKAFDAAWKAYENAGYDSDLHKPMKDAYVAKVKAFAEARKAAKENVQ